MKNITHLLFLFFALSGSFALAETPTSNITLINGWLRETPPNIKNAAAFVSLHNNSNNTKHIIAIQCSDLAARCEIHEHLRTADGKMRMQKVSAPLAIAGNSTLSMQPGGYHIMLFDIKTPLRAGNTAAFTVVFDDQSALTVQLPIKSIRAE